MGVRLMKVTIKDIARKANVSSTTVSFVLNNKASHISPETIKKVKKVANDLRYVPNPIAISLVTKKTKTIGMIIPDIQNLFFAEIAKLIEAKLIEKGYHLIICNTDDRHDRDLKALEQLINRNVDGIIVTPSTESLKPDNVDRILNVMFDSNIPLLFADRDFPQSTHSRVVSNNEYGAYIATQHLIEHGHKKIACITGPQNVSSAKGRLLGYKKALEDANISIDENLIIEGDYQFDGGYKAALSILKHQPTALFASNDLMAYGAYKACKEVGFSIPNDLSVVGYDDLYFSTMLDIPLTTVKQDREQMAKIISEVILAQAENDDYDSQHTMIKPTLTERASVKRLG